MDDKFDFKLQISDFNVLLSKKLFYTEGVYFHILNYQKMDVQYIKNDNGQIAYAVVPIDVWESTLSQAHEPVIAYGKVKDKDKPFDVRDYFGIINLNMTEEQIAHELNELRSEWDRDF